MILYHGGTEAVMQPDCKKGRPDLDFGQGFYVTLLQDQAEGFARRKARDRKSKPVISVYEFYYEAAIEDCVYLNFEFYDEAWLDFVSDNRSGIDRTAGYDLICGPVANDDVYQTFILYSTGVYSKEQTLEALKIKKLYNQCVFTTDLALSFITFKEAKFGKEHFDG